MGWQRGTVTLAWSERHELHGLEIVMRRQPLGQVLDEWMTQDDEPADWDALTPKERAVRSTENAASLIKQVISWNLDDRKGVPVPVTVEGLLGECDSLMINQMRLAYSVATTKLPPPLPESSDDGPGEWDLPAQEVLPAEPPD